MLANREWARYAVKRAALRVTRPSPGQRSTYSLQLPYWWSIPLLVASIALHWLISQSIFLARIAVYKDGTPVSAYNDRLKSMYSHLAHGGTVFTGLGYSNIALFATIGWGAFLIVALLVVAGIGTYSRGLPLGGTNSAVISAACHLKYADEEGQNRDAAECIVLKELQWGVTITAGNEGQVGHCSFSDREVQRPLKDCVYA